MLLGIVIMKADPFAALLQQFFADYLQAQRSLSSHTIAAYRDTFKLLLAFLSSHWRRPIDQLTLCSLRPDAILAFLEHLERVRDNTARTRNVRLAAIRTFVRFVIGQAPADAFLAQAQRILAIPLKKSPQRLLGFLTRQEIDAVLSCIDESTWSGQRDRTLFLLLYNTGARVGEALQLQGRDLQDRAVLLHGKGRKERTTPLWLRTERLLRRWLRLNQVGADAPVFTNRDGAQLSRDGVAHRLCLAVRRAVQRCPSLAGRAVTPHTLRHTCCSPASLLR
jgi:integrase/recombinase XerD